MRQVPVVIFALVNTNVFAKPSLSGSGGKAVSPFNGFQSADATAAVLQSDGKIILAGKASSASQTLFALARFNPVNWTVEAAREALAAGADWGFVGLRLGLLLVLAIVGGWVATRAFRAYQRSV